MSKLTPEQIDLIYQANLKDTESKSYKLAIVNKIPLEQTGFEALACHRKEQGEGFVKLLHLILINLYLEYQDFEEIFLKYFVDYVNESIPKRIISIDKENLRKNLGIRYYLNILMLKRYFKEYKSLEIFETVEVKRKIEFCAYFTLVSLKIDFLNSVGISNNQHYTFNQEENIDYNDKNFLISRCLLPTVEYPNYGQLISFFKEVQYDTWLKKQIPKVVIRGVFSTDEELPQSQNLDFKDILERVKTLIRNPSKIKKLLEKREGEDKTVITFLAFLGLLIIWKDGFTVFGFVPVFGDLFTTLGNTVYGRMMGIIIYGFLLLDYKFNFSIREMTKGDNKIILIVILLILFVSALLI